MRISDWSSDVCSSDLGVDCHIGSQITEVGPYVDALGKLIALIESLADVGIHLKHLDLGGGIGIRYTDETLLSPTTLLDKVFQALDQHHLGHLQIVLEPGRSLVGDRKSTRLNSSH